MKGIIVCIATYRRPKSLRLLLRALDRQTAGSASAALSVIVVDNDAAESAREICALARKSRIQIEYLVEPRRGIACVRNRAVTAALARGAEIVAIIDDDEAPAPGWLGALLKEREASGAHLIHGPVLPRFVQRPPAWIVDGGFFRRDKPPRIGTTANLLVACEVFKSIGLFDERLNFALAEDTHFLIRAQRAGFKKSFAERALVYESVPPARANAQWLLRRSFHTGNAWVRCGLLLDPGPWVKISYLARAVVLGSFRLLTLPFYAAGKARLVRALCRLAGHAGQISAIFGGKYKEHS